MLSYPVQLRQVYRDQAILPAVDLPHPMPLVQVQVVVVENATNLFILILLSVIIKKMAATCCYLGIIKTVRTD
jgi:hypothetical protein